MEGIQSLAGSLSPKPAFHYIHNKSLDITHAIMAGTITTRKKSYVPPKDAEKETSREEENTPSREEENTGEVFEDCNGDPPDELQAGVSHTDPATPKTDNSCTSESRKSSAIDNSLSLDEIEDIIGKTERGDTGAISDGINQIHALLVANQRALNAHIIDSSSQFSKLNSRLDKVGKRLDFADRRLDKHENEIKSPEANKASAEEIKFLKQDIGDLKSRYEKAFTKMARDRDMQASILATQEQQLPNTRLEAQRIAYTCLELKERQNVSDIRAKHFSLTIDNLPEAKGKSVVDTVVERLNADAKGHTWKG